jgi:tetratricopeptide (TPR) repeat protein
MALARKHWIMIGGAAVCLLLLSLAPRSPKAKAEGEQASARVSEDPNSGSTPHTEEAGPGGDASGPTSKDPQVNAIIAELNEAMAKGQPPMVAIKKLRDLADSEPNNVEAQYHLGLFSWQSGQYDKAMDRFKKVIALDPKGYPDAYAFLAQAYGTLDSTDKAIAAIETYKTLVTDTALLHGADRFLADLRTKKNN